MRYPSGGRVMRKWLCVGVILSTAVFAYIPALSNGFVWDDDAYVTDNKNLRDLRGLQRIWLSPTSIPQYYPVTHTTFWIEHQLWGLNPAGYHGVNVLLHGLCAVLLWLLLVRLGVPGALLAAVVFALHPVHVESAAWITERKNVLSGLFYLAAFLSYLRYAGVVERAVPRNLKYYVTALLFFAGAVLSKSVTATLPAAILLVLWWKRPRLGWADVKPLLPMFAGGMVMGMVTAALEKYHVGAVGHEWAFSIIDRVLIAGRALWFYAGKILYPYRLTFIYERWSIDAGVWWQYMFPAAALAVIGVLWFKRRRIGKGPLTAVLFFAGTLFPALGFLDVYPMRYSFVADHFQYLASIGLIVLAVGAAARCLRGRPRIAYMLPAALMLLVLGTATWRQCYMYKDRETLWRTTISRNDTAWIAYLNLGIILNQKGDRERGYYLYQRALDIYPGSPLVHYNMGVVLMEWGRVQEAVEHYKRAAALNSAHIPTRLNLGIALSALDKPAAALPHFEAVMSARSGDPEIHYLAGGIVAAMGRLDYAEKLYRRALELRPDFARAHNKLGLVLTQRARPREAIYHLYRAIKLDPGCAETFFNLGAAYQYTGETEAAERYYRQALNLKADYPEAYNNLGILYILGNRHAEAAEQFRLALRYRPEFSDAAYNLGLIEKKNKKK